MLILVYALLLQSNVPPGLREGLTALNRGDLVAAGAFLESASQEHPDNAVIWAALAQVYLKKEQKPAALEAALTAERLAPNEPTIQHALAMFYTGAGDPAKAAGLERRFAASSMADADASFRAAQLYLQAGNTADAIATATAALAQNDSPPLHQLLAHAYQAAKQPAKALEEYRAAVHSAPDDEELLFDFTQALFRSEGFAEAAALLEVRRLKFPTDPQTELTLGVAYYGLRRFPEAVTAFLQTIALAPDLEQPYLFLSRMLEQAGPNLAGIQNKFEQYRNRHPASYLGSFALAKALILNGGTPDRIEALLRDTIAKNGTLWEPHSELADVLAKQHDYPGAAAEWERAAALNPSEPSIPFRLARAYDRLGLGEKAAAQRARHRELQSHAKSGMGTDSQ